MSKLVVYSLHFLSAEINGQTHGKKSSLNIIILCGQGNILRYLTANTWQIRSYLQLDGTIKNRLWSSLVRYVDQMLLQVGHG